MTYAHALNLKKGASNFPMFYREIETHFISVIKLVLGLQESCSI